MDRASYIFCVGSVLVCLGIAVIAFPAASVSRVTLEAAQTPKDAEEMQDMDLGEFGVVSVLELLDYFLENPPKETTVESERIYWVSPNTEQKFFTGLFDGLNDYSYISFGYQI